MEGLTQEATAERMGITARHLRKLQRLSVQTLATHMLENLARGAHPDEPSASTSQVTCGLVSLEETATRLTASVGESLRGALSLVQMLECMRSVEELARALGAVGYVAKPVGRQASPYRCQEEITCWRPACRILGRDDLARHVYKARGGAHGGENLPTAQI